MRKDHHCLRFRFAALLTIAALCLTACSGSKPEDDAGDVRLPEPPAQEAQLLLGSNSLYSRDVLLYCATDGSMELTPIARTIRSDGDLLRDTLTELLNTVPGSSALLVGSADSQLLGVEQSSGTATVRLALDAGTNRSEQDYLLLSASIAATLLGLPDVEAVNILSGDRSNAVCGLPLGALVTPDGNVAAAYARMQAEAGRKSRFNRNALLYFPAQYGDYLLPEVRELSFAEDDCAAVLIAALQAGPLKRGCCFSPIPSNLELLMTSPELGVTPGGERICELRFSSTFANYLALSGAEPWQLYGSVVLSLTSFIPDLDAVRISIEDVNVTECAIGSSRLQFEEGLMRRSDFSPLIGSSAALYFTNADDKLVRVDCAMSQAAARDPLRILSAMMNDAQLQSLDLKRAFPAGILPSDILGVQVAEQLATVNLSGHFYSRCQSLDMDAERALVYAMIDALSELEQINAVAFLVEGEAVETLSQNVYLRTALIPDFSLVLEQ